MKLFNHKKIISLKKDNIKNNFNIFTFDIVASPGFNSCIIINDAKDIFNIPNNSVFYDTCLSSLYFKNTEGNIILMNIKNLKI